jgi:hypothetical protein
VESSRASTGSSRSRTPKRQVAPIHPVGGPCHGHIRGAEDPTGLGQAASGELVESDWLRLHNRTRRGMRPSQRAARPHHGRQGSRVDHVGLHTLRHSAASVMLSLRKCVHLGPHTSSRRHFNGVRKSCTSLNARERRSLATLLATRTQLDSRQSGRLSGHRAVSSRDGGPPRRPRRSRPSATTSRPSRYCSVKRRPPRRGTGIQPCRPPARFTSVRNPTPRYLLRGPVRQSSGRQVRHDSSPCLAHDPGGVVTGSGGVG